MSLCSKSRPFFAHKLTFGGQAVDGSRWILVLVILAIFILATVLPRLREGGRESQAASDFGGIFDRITSHHEGYGILVALRRFQYRDLRIEQRCRNEVVDAPSDALGDYVSIADKMYEHHVVSG